VSGVGDCAEMTISRRQALGLAAGWAATARGQQTEREYRIYTEHPRIWLTAQRLRLLRRERERTSQRWQQLDALVGGKARMAEPGFASALYFQVSQNEAFARQAVAWAQTPQADTRQVALVYDWCQEALRPAEKAALEGKLNSALLGAKAPADFSALRTTALAAVVLGKHETLQALEGQWKKMIGALAADTRMLNGQELLAVLELLHAIQDNTNNDWREDESQFFANLARVQLLSYFPAPFPAAENEFRIQAYLANTDPDVRQAALARAAELALVAFDRNATDHQFLQGWLNQDRFLMLGPLGVTYEFLWANPYQPGLTYQNLPLHYYDPKTARLFVRSDWEEDAGWFGLVDRKPLFFREGKRQTGMPPDLVLGEVHLMRGSAPIKFDIKKEEPSMLFLLGMKPDKPYVLEVDYEEMDEVRTDPAGTLALNLKRPRNVGARLSEPFAAPQPKA
jgi:hypothetical protein